MVCLLVLPNQLFDIKNLQKLEFNEIIIYEHPHYFQKYNYNKKKLMLHRISMRKYYKALQLGKIYKVRYLNFWKSLPKSKSYLMYNPIDKISLPPNIEIMESPNFLTSTEMYKSYQNKTKKFIFNNFYLWCKQELNIYPELRSMDKLNRQKYKGETIPLTPKINSSPEIKYAKLYVEKYFPNNLGNTSNFSYPTTTDESKKWLADFLKNKFELYGPYQDYSIQSNSTMYHSVLSSSINIGLLNPSDIIVAMKPFYDKIKINSFEGYLRQLFWREYQRYCFEFINFDIQPYFENNTIKIDKSWYNGTTGIPPIDDLIISGFDTGYIHHIGRLMVIGNYMNLCNIHPNEGYKWFMEVSIDSYEWVMHQNVYDMVFFVTGGKTTRKPYTTSSNYVLNMTDYKKDGWCGIWNYKYKEFLKNNYEKLWKFRFHFPGLHNILL